jgi:hypothetical protein
MKREGPDPVRADPRGRNDAINPLAVAGFLVVLWLLLSLFSFLLVAAPRVHRFDFFPLWTGARTVLRGEMPYSDEIAWQIQEGMFGRRLASFEDQYRFVYSATIAWALLPFWLLPFPWAVSLWLGFQLALLLIVPIWVTVILEWKLRRIPLTLLLVFSILLFRYPINAYLIGQFIPFCLACLVAGWWGIVRDRWILASVALVLAMVRPEVVLIPVLTLLAAAWVKGDRRIAYAWISGMLGMWALTRAWIGPWEAAYLNAMRVYRTYASLLWPPGLVKSPWLIGLILFLVVLWNLWVWRELQTLKAAERIGGLLSIATLNSLILLSQTGNYTLILALVSAWFILWLSRKRIPFWIPVLAVLASPWLFHFASGIPAIYEQLLIPVSFAILLAFYWQVSKWSQNERELRLLR